MAPIAVLNVGLERLYYTNLSGEPNSIKKGAISGFSLGKIDVDSNEEFESRVGNNNFIHPTDPNCNRIYVERVVGLQPDPNGMMKMRNLEDPCSGQMIFARAKGEFAPVVEDEIRIRFNYLFTTTDPHAKIVVYLSDVPELLALDDPNRALHYIEVARVSAPPVPRPGSAGSGRFGNFEKYVSTSGLDLSKGTWIELELIEPVQGPLFGRGSYKLAGAGEGTIVYANDWDAGVYCSVGYCLDLNWSTYVTEADFLIVVGGAGRIETPCLDGAFGRDGYADWYDTLSWDWAMNDIDVRGSLCGEDGHLRVPLSPGGYGMISGLYQYLDNQLALVDLSDLNDLLIAGKRGTTGGPAKLKDRLYVFDTNDSNASYIQGLEPEPNRCNLRIVRGVGDDLYQINSEDGVSRLEDHLPIVPPGGVAYANEPRYNQPAMVYVGIRGPDDDPFGRPILDAAFDANFVYVVPVVVVPNGGEPNVYVAAAKLALDQNSPPYHVVRLYDGPLLSDDNDNQREYRNTLREIEIDAVGNVYVTNANFMNESDILWKFEPNGNIVRFNLRDPNGPCHIWAPIGMCVSSGTNMLYLASSLYSEADPNSAVVHGFSTDTLAPVRTITVSGIQHVTSIAEDPITNALWVTGFSFNVPTPDPLDMQQYVFALPFYDPYLAKVPKGVNNVSAVCLDANDLAMPLSIVWTGARPVQEKCGGADLDGDGTVSLSDLAKLVGYWLDMNCGNSNDCERADLEPEANPDGDVDFKDFNILAEHWLDTGCLGP